MMEQLAARLAHRGVRAQFGICETKNPMQLPKSEISVTEHRFGVGGQSSTAGKMIIRDDEEKSVASIGYQIVDDRGRDAFRSSYSRR